MARVICDISTSLDGFIAGPNQTLEQPLGEGGEGLHEWAYELASFRERHGMDGGETGADDEVVKESLAAQGAVVMGRGGCSAAEQARGRTTPMRTAGGGTTLRSAFRCSSSPTTLVNPSQSKAEPRSRSSPTGSKPHSSKLGRPPATGTCSRSEERRVGKECRSLCDWSSDVCSSDLEPVTKQGGTTFTFVTDGIEAALEQARAAAGDRDVFKIGRASCRERV